LLLLKKHLPLCILLSFYVQTYPVSIYESGLDYTLGEESLQSQITTATTTVIPKKKRPQQSTPAFMTQDGLNSGGSRE